MFRETDNSDNKIEVVVTAIDGECLVLETVPYKNRICWPLKNIPRPLDIGSKLTLELQQNGTDTLDLDAGISEQTGNEDENKRQLLEKLVN